MATFTFGKVSTGAAARKEAAEKKGLQAPAPKKAAKEIVTADTLQIGRVSVQTKQKYLNVEKFDPLLVDHFLPSESHYYIFLLDKVTKDARILKQLQTDIETVGIKSYFVLSSITLSSVNNENDQTKNLVTFESPWREYLEFDGQKCSAIMSFGRTIRVLNRSADINYFDFLDDLFMKQRYFCGSAYVGGPDRWVYPVAPIDFIYPFRDVGKGDFVCYHTRHFRKQLSRLMNDDYSLDELDTRPIEIIDCSEDDKIDDALDALMDSEILAADTETNGFSPHLNKLGTVQLCNDGVHSYFFDWATLKEHKRKFTKCLRSAKRLVLANAKFDIAFFHTNGVRVMPTDDTVLLSHCMNSNVPKGLKPNTWIWCGNFGGYDDKLDKIKEKMKVRNYLQIPKPILMEYAAIDPAVTWRQLIKMEEWCHHIDKTIPNEKIPEWTMWNFYKEIMIPNLRALIMIQMNGTFFSLDQIAESEKKIQDVIDEEAKNMSELWGVPPTFEFSSTDKLGQLFEKMGWPELERNAKGVYSTADPILQEYERLKMPGIKNLKRYRSFMVARNTFCRGWREFVVTHEDGSTRVHPVANAFGVVSFRHAMNDPNFQQIPSAKEIAHYVKQFFVSPPSHELIEVEDDKGNKWSNELYLNVLTPRGSVRFEDLQEDDEILDYDKEHPLYETAWNWEY